eukprot:13376499-Alexandrium_andersonii.AAC.2
MTKLKGSISENGNRTRSSNVRPCIHSCFNTSDIAGAEPSLFPCGTIKHLYHKLCSASTS